MKHQKHAITHGYEFSDVSCELTHLRHHVTQWCFALDANANTNVNGKKMQTWLNVHQFKDQVF